MLDFVVKVDLAVDSVWLALEDGATGLAGDGASAAKL